MSVAEVVYQTELEEAHRAALEVSEVDGIPVELEGGELHRIGMFSVKEDGGKWGDSQVSSDVSMIMEIRWFCSSSFIEADAFFPYEEARFWSHP